MIGVETHRHCPKKHVPKRCFFMETARMAGIKPTGKIPCLEDLHSTKCSRSQNNATLALLMEVYFRLHVVGQLSAFQEHEWSSCQKNTCTMGQVPCRRPHVYRNLSLGVSVAKQAFHTGFQEDFRKPKLQCFGKFQSSSSPYSLLMFIIRRLTGQQWKQCIPICLCTMGWRKQGMKIRIDVRPK